MKYLFVFLLLGLVSCGQAPPIEKNNTNAVKTIDTIQDINGVNRVDTTLNKDERTPLEPKIYPSVKIGELEVMTEDLGRTWQWDEANERCAKISGNWRLPTITELELLHENMDSIGGFKIKPIWGAHPQGYWSSEDDKPSEEDKLLEGVAYFFSFRNAGHYRLTPKGFQNRVRAVRTIK